MHHLFVVCERQAGAHVIAYVAATGKKHRLVQSRTIIIKAEWASPNRTAPNKWRSSINRAIPWKGANSSESNNFLELTTLFTDTQALGTKAPFVKTC